MFFNVTLDFGQGPMGGGELLGQSLDKVPGLSSYGLLWLSMELSLRAEASIHRDLQLMPLA